jgi:hypothetical protein
MDGLGKIDKDELIRRMRADFEKTMAEVTQAVSAAPDGHWIDASEERCRDALGEFRRKTYETAVQMRVEATEANVAFPPSGAGAPRGGQPHDPKLLRQGPVAAAALRKPAGRDGRPGGRSD